MTLLFYNNNYFFGTEGANNFKITAKSNILSLRKGKRRLRSRLNKEALDNIWRSGITDSENNFEMWNRSLIQLQLERQKTAM
jgi:hypothetical protein